jgi:hypothetical protein
MFGSSRRNKPTEETMITKLYAANAENADNLRNALTQMGVKKARVRVMKYGAARLVLNSVEDRDAARDALVLANAVDCTGKPFTDPSTKHAWNGPVEIFVRFTAP